MTLAVLFVRTKLLDADILVSCGGWNKCDFAPDSLGGVTRSWFVGALAWKLKEPGIVLAELFMIAVYSLEVGNNTAQRSCASTRRFELRQR
jgi:hypothetical protein